MFLITAAKCLLGKSADIELPKRNMIIDPRPNNQRERINDKFGIYFLKFGKFECMYHDNGTTVTLIRADEDEVFEMYRGQKAIGLDIDRSDVEAAGDDYFQGPFQFRVFDPSIEQVPDFVSTRYVYLGIVGEKAPPDTTLLIIDPTVSYIQREAFAGCDKIQKCIMHDNVEAVGFWAFVLCSSMTVINLSRSLRYIEPQAFESCASLEALFLPQSLEKIDAAAFAGCDNLRILPLSSYIESAEMVIHGCDTLLDLTQTSEYAFEEDTRDIINNDEVHQSVIDFYNNLPPLHRTCLDPAVNAFTIHACIDTHGLGTAAIRDHDGMMPLHILAMNPHADVGAIGACFRANMTAAFARDNRGNTPLDYLKQNHNIEHHTFLMAYLCVLRNKK